MTREEAIYWIKTIDALGIDDGAGSIVIALKMAIEALNAERWIPCSDHLPKESGTYFVTAYDGHCKRTSFMKYQKKYQRWDLTGTRTYWQVMAWMPLPGSWEGEAS